MLLRLKKWRAIKQSALIIPYALKDPKTGVVQKSGHLHFSKIGDTHEVEDRIGYTILGSYEDMLELVEPLKITKAVKSPANK